MRVPIQELCTYVHDCQVFGQLLGGNLFSTLQMVKDACTFKKANQRVYVGNYNEAM